MAENIKTTFPAMGDDGIPRSVVNMSGQRAPYTQEVPKQGGQSGDLASGDGIRTSTEIQHAQGPTLAPITRIYADNAAEATASMRNVRVVPGRGGVDDFYLKRAESNTIG